MKTGVTRIIEQLGGDPPKKNQTGVEKILEILENGGGGSSLPQVTSDDNGDVLAVVDGEWSKAPAPSSLPSYTSADIGKVLTLGEGEGEPFVVVPEQTVTIPAGETSASLSDVPTLEEAPNSIRYVLVYMGNTLSGVAEKDENLRYQLGASPFYLSFGQDDIFFFEILQTVQSDLTVSISASVYDPSVELKWETASGGLKVVGAAPNTDANNQANLLLVVDGVTLTDYDSVSEFVNNNKAVVFVANGSGGVTTIIVPLSSTFTPADTAAYYTLKVNTPGGEQTMTAGFIAK